MSPVLTFGDFLTSLRGNSLAIYSVEPLPDELNAGDIEPFVAPSADAIVSLKEQVSYEAWLYLMEADSLGVEYNRLLGQREAQRHLTRSIALLDFKDRNTPLNSQAVKTRIHWLQRRVLNLGGDTTPKPYYQLMAEGQMARARKQDAVTTVWNMLSLKERLHRLQERWGDLSPEALEEREQQAQQRQAQENTITVVQRRIWDLEIEHPAFAPWFVQELVCREPLEIEAYLTVMWHVGNATAPALPGDARQNISAAQVPYVLGILAPAIADTTGKAQRILKRTRKWIKEQVKASSSTTADISLSAETNQSALSHRQIALREYYGGRTIQNDARAQKLAKENNLTSSEVLIKKYRKVVKEGGITNVGKHELQPMIADLLRVKEELKNKDEIYKLDIHLRMLQAEYRRTGPD